MNAAVETSDAVLEFWRAAGRERWFNKDPDFDTAIRTRFHTTWRAAGAFRLDDWEMAADSALALVIVLDQFPRNMFRGRAEAYSTDAHALAVAERAIARGHDARVDAALRNFFYLPHMHAEDLRVQARCVALFRAAGLEEGTRYALVHEDVIRRFGRFPHRNPALGRTTTAEEQAFLDAGGFAG